MTRKIQDGEAVSNASSIQKSRPLRKKVSLYVGLAMMIITSVLLATGVMIPGISVKTELYGNEFDFNFSFFIYSAIIFAGLSITSLYFRNIRSTLKFGKKPTLGDNMVWSIPITRFIAGTILIVMATISFTVFGLGFSNENKVGVWAYLAGPSLFFPTGFMSLLFGIIIVIYALFGIKSVIVVWEGNTCNIVERRLFGMIKTSILKDEMEFARFTNARIGPRHLWSVVFFFQIWLLYVDGFAFLANPHAFGTGFLAGTMYVASATVQLVALSLLLLARKYNIEIITKDRIYEVQFESVSKAESLSLQSIFNVESSEVSTTCPKNSYTRLVIGLVFLVTAIISRVFIVYAGSVLRFVLVFSSAVLVSEAIMKDLHVKPRDSRISGRKAADSLYRAVRGSRVDEIANLAQATSLSPASVPRKLELQDHFVTAGVSGAIGMDIISTTNLGGIGNPMVDGIIATHVVLGIVLLVLVLMVTVDIRNAIEIDAGIKKYQLFMGKAKERNDRTSNIFKRWFEKAKANRTQSLKRVVEIIGAFSVGIIAGILLTLL